MTTDQSSEEEPQDADSQAQKRPSPPSTPAPPSDEERLSLTGRTTVTLFDQDQLAPLFFTILFVSTTVAFLYVLHDFLGDLVMAFILIGLVRRPYEWLVSHTSKNPWIASGIVTLLVLLIIVAPLVGLGYTVAAEAATAYGASESFLPGGHRFVEEVVAWLRSLGIGISKSTVLGYLNQIAGKIESAAVATGGAVLSNVLGMTIHLLTVLVMVFYVLVDGQRLRRFLFKLSPLPDDEDALLEETFRKVAKGVVVGQGLGSAIQGVLGGLSFWIVGLPSPVLWGSVMALAAFLPLVGVTFVAIPASLYLYVTGSPAPAIGLLVFNIAQGTLIDNVVKTKMIGSSMRMHDLLVFLSVLGGIAAFGIIGVVYGPLIAMLFMTLSDLYDRVYRPKLAQRFAERR